MTFNDLFTLGWKFLAPETVRRLGCDASIIPMVLGSKGQPHQHGLTATVTVTAFGVTWQT